jgi:leucyl aminopeptidase
MIAAPRSTRSSSCSRGASSHSRPRATLGACLLGSAALLGACSEAAAEPASPAQVLEERQSALTDDVWITTGRDSIELVRRVVGPAAQRLSQRDSPRQRDEVALRVPRASLYDISEAQHTEHHRCGGFMLQESEAEAMASLAAPDGVQRDLYFLAPPYTIDNAATVDKLLPEIKEPNVLATIRKLSSYRTRFHTSTTGEEAAVYIRDSWKALSAGRDDITVELVDHMKTPQPSIKLTWRGSSLPSEIVVLGGHMDSISGRGSNTALAPGADDNASGIAVLTEVLRAAVALHYRPARTVVFYGYAAEEIGLVGSAEIAARAKADALNVVGVLQLDMTNFTTAAAPFIGLLTDFVDKPLNDFSVKLIEQYVKLPYKMFACGYACSDHASWTKHGFPAVSPHEADMKSANQQIHTTNDTLALSKDSAAHSMHFVRFGLAFMAELAKGGIEVPPSATACDAAKPCARGQRCDNGVCVAELDAGVLPDAGSAAIPGAPRAPSAACSAAVPCLGGLTCIAGTCGVAGDSTGKLDAAVGQPDASAGPGIGVSSEGGALVPTTTGVHAVVGADAGAILPDSDRPDGCSIAPANNTRAKAWPLWFAALGLLALGRRRRAV